MKKRKETLIRLASGEAAIVFRHPKGIDIKSGPGDPSNALWFAMGIVAALSDKERPGVFQSVLRAAEACKDVSDSEPACKDVSDSEPACKVESDKEKEND